MTRNIKIITSGLTVAAALALPAGAMAKGADRNHDRIPDRWEVAHHLSLKTNEARRDQDHDGLDNLAEFKHHTNPRVADSDRDGIEDGTEVRDHSNPLVAEPENEAEQNDANDDNGVDPADGEVENEAEQNDVNDDSQQVGSDDTASTSTSGSGEVETESGRHGSDG